MPLFNYKAKKGPEEVIESSLEAKTKEEAIAKISELGYVPVKVVLQQETGASLGSKSKFNFNLRLSGKIKARDITIFIEQLASLIRSKIPVFEAVNIIAAQTENPEFKKVVASVSAEIKDGRTLSESLSRYPRIFPRLFINMIQSGESGGVLEETLNRLALFRQEEEDLKAKITSSLVYPAFIMLVGFATIFVLLTFGVPRLTILFADMDQILPLPTRILIIFSDGLRQYWHWGALFILAGVLIVKKQGLIKKNQEAIDKLKLKLPLLGDFFKEALLARFSRTFSTLLANGIPVFESLNITIPALGNEIFKKELEIVKNEVMAGVSFAQSMRKSSWFPFFVVNMIAVSEKRGDLEGGLAEVADFYERQVNKQMKIMTSLLEPAIILIMGLIVAFIVLAMILPVFEISVGMG